MPTPLNLPRRPRRLRSTPAVRELLQEHRLHPAQFIAPLFVQDTQEGSTPVDSMPGVCRHSVASAVEHARELSDLGIHALALFPCIQPRYKNDAGSHAFKKDNLTFRALRALRKALPKMTLVADVALDPYTSHGHDGLIDPKTGDVENDRTVEALCKLAVMEAEAGASWVAPSDMMDGRVRAIREALDSARQQEISILSYAAKFASAYYGPFRDAVGSKQAAGKTYLDKRTYQLNPANPREALHDALLDEPEGADLLMVKPAGPYLDIIHRLRQATRLPVVAYQVSGEYAQIHAAAAKGWINLEAARHESVLAIRRAGADLIITYFADTLARELAGS